jgi:riboflavin synthase
MFTGIIAEVGRVRSLRRSSQGATISVSAERILAGAPVGGSVAVNGVCLTMTGIEEKSFAADVSEETLRRTALGQLTVGSRVNLELPLAVGDHLGGHIVQGHVDGTGRFLSKRPAGESFMFRFAYPQELGRYIVLKGSIAVDGISLTLAGLSERWFEVAIIPHTIKLTNLSSLNPGDPVNLEIDILAKYVERLLQARLGAEQPSQPPSTLTVEGLKELGY